MTQPLFVVQRHDATRLHFDLRLEIDGALASWAVPKGPSLDPSVRRLAVHVEDHDLAHADVEGRLGTGTVVIWDRGTWVNATRRSGRAVPAADAVVDGHLRFVLTGQRLNGGFALTRTRMGGEDRHWLLVKIDDEYADRVR